MRLGLVAALTALALALSAAPAAAKHTPVIGEFHGAVLDQEGDALTVVATIDPSGGPRLVVHGDLHATADGYDGTFVLYAPAGTVRGDARFSLYADGGSASLSGDLTATGGTGSFAKASGAISVEGMVDLVTGVINASAEGVLHATPARKQALPPARRHAHDATIRAVVVEDGGASARLVGDVTGYTGRPGMMVLEAPQGMTTASVPWTYADGRGQIRGVARIRRDEEVDGSVLVTVERNRITGGSGRYRRVESVRRRAGEPGSRDPATGVLTFHFAGVLRY